MAWQVNSTGRHGSMGRVSASEALASEPEDDGAPGPAGSAGRRALKLHPLAVTAVWVLGVIAAFACYLRLSRTRAVNSDGAGRALHAWARPPGNLLLRGWSLRDRSFQS